MSQQVVRDKRGRLPHDRFAVAVRRCQLTGGGSLRLLLGLRAL